MRNSLTYDDIQLVPQYSNIPSRTQINLKTLVSRRYGILNPIVASPMDTVCELEMAYKIFKLGGVGCIHRFNTIEEQSEIIKELYHRIYSEEWGGQFESWGVMVDNWHSEIPHIPIMASIGVSESDKDRAKSLVDNGCNIIVIDVAHGHHKNVEKILEWCKENLDDKVDIIAGNIATKEAAQELESWGADGLRVGIGGGSLCTTRVKTGFGVPNVSCLEDIVSVAKTPVMADGGIRSSGDISKALAIGASSVMLGSLIAGTDEAPGQIVETQKGLYKRYRGSASLETKVTHGQQTRNVEGESTTIPYKGGVKFIVNGLIDGVKSALSYGGAKKLEDFNPPYVKVTNSGINEAKPHLL
jgi:IMP dehydrogenase